MASPRATATRSSPIRSRSTARRCAGWATRSVDLLVRRIDELGAGPVLRTATRDELEARIDEPAPEGRGDFDDLLARLDRDVLPFVGHFDHPRFFGYIPGAGTWPAALGDLIAAATNIDSGRLAGVFRSEPARADRPRLVPRVDRLPARVRGRARVRRIGGEPDGDRLRTGGDRRPDVAADRRLRQRPDPLVASPAPRAISGSAPTSSGSSPTDDRFRIRVDDLAAAIDADAAAGRLPFLVIANAGTTNTGAVDDLPALARLCRERGIWLHVDGAYGAFAVLTERGRAALAGSRAGRLGDARPAQVAGDAVRGRLPDGPRRRDARAGLRPPPGVPAGAFRRPAGRELRRPRAAADPGEPGDQGLAGDRDVRPRGVPRDDRSLAGPGRRRPAPDRGATTGSSSSARRRSGILTFRRRAIPGETAEETDRRNEAIVTALAAAGDVLLTSTLIDGRYAIRLCVLNHTSGPGDVAYALDRVAVARAAGADAATARPAPAGAGRAPGRPDGRSRRGRRCRRRRAPGDRAVRVRHRRPGRRGSSRRAGGSATRSASRSRSAGRWPGRSTSSAGPPRRSGSAIARSTPSARATTSARSRRWTGAATSATPGRPPCRDRADRAARVAGRALRELMARPGRGPGDPAVAQERLASR